MSGSSSLSSSSFGVIVHWNYENAWVPDDYDLTTLKMNIEAALKKHNPEFFIKGNLIAVGPGSGDKYQLLSRVPDITISPIPTANMRCDNESCNNLVVHSPGDNKEQLMRKTHITDKYMVLKMFMTAIENIKNNILIISRDINFVSAIDGLRDRNVFVMLALCEDSSRDLYDLANVTWLWSSVNADDPNTMIKGGKPVACNNNPRPLRG